MAIPLRYLLVSDGPTDRVLLPIIDWVREEETHRLFRSFGCYTSTRQAGQRLLWTTGLAAAKLVE